MFCSGCPTLIIGCPWWSFLMNSSVNHDDIPPEVTPYRCRSPWKRHHRTTGDQSRPDMGHLDMVEWAINGRIISAVILKGQMSSASAWRECRAMSAELSARRNLLKPPLDESLWRRAGPPAQIGRMWLGTRYDNMTLLPIWVRISWRSTGLVVEGWTALWPPWPWSDPGAMRME